MEEQLVTLLKEDIIQIFEKERKEGKLLKGIREDIKRNCWHLKPTNITQNALMDNYLKIIFSVIFKKYLSSKYDDFIITWRETETRSHLVCIHILIEMKKKGRTKETITWYMEETFNCCGVMTVHELAVNNYEYSNINKECFADIMRMIEKMGKTFDYSCLLYIASDYENTNMLREYLENNWTLLSKFRNKRGNIGNDGNQLKIFQKLI